MGRGVIGLEEVFCWEDSAAVGCSTSRARVRWDGKKFKKVFSREEGLFVGWVLLQCIAEFAEHEEVRKDGRRVIGREEGLFVGRVLLQWVAETARHFDRAGLQVCIVRSIHARTPPQLRKESHCLLGRQQHRTYF